jgi:hypothetical protein
VEAANKIQAWYRGHVGRIATAKALVPAKRHSKKVDFAEELTIDGIAMRKVSTTESEDLLVDASIHDGWEEDDGLDDALLDDNDLSVTEDPVADMAPPSEDGWSDDEVIDFDDSDLDTNGTKLLSTSDNITVSSALLPPAEDSSPLVVKPPQEDVMARFKAQLEASVNTWVANALVVNGSGYRDPTLSSSDHDRTAWDPSLEAYLSRARQARRQAGLYE